VFYDIKVGTLFNHKLLSSLILEWCS